MFFATPSLRGSKERGAQRLDSKARDILKEGRPVSNVYFTVPTHANKHKILLAVKKGGVNHEVLLASARRSHRSDVWSVARFLQILAA